MAESGAPLPHTCPYCGKPMESGWVVGQASAGALQPATIAWIPAGNPPEGRGLMDSVSANALVEIGITRFALVPRFPAFRCVGCAHVEFRYRDPVLKA